MRTYSTYAMLELFISILGTMFENVDARENYFPTLETINTYYYKFINHYYLLIILSTDVKHIIMIN